MHRAANLARHHPALHPLPVPVPRLSDRATQESLDDSVVVFRNSTRHALRVGGSSHFFAPSPSEPGAEDHSKHPFVTISEPVVGLCHGADRAWHFIIPSKRDIKFRV